jgi:hypothetical protein
MPVLRDPLKMPIFRKLTFMVGNHAVFNFINLQLTLNGLNILSWPLQNVKNPKGLNSKRIFFILMKLSL